eukprot:Nitzschia sp. Nitz4//scaffold32_size149145//84049//86889//NITZ4_002885-RA/size149145-augustus-gene-0.39-mRNA-1//1//CDS//3329548087//6146//frame0
MSKSRIAPSTVGGGSGLRRRKPQVSSDTLVSLIDRLQREEGRHLDIQFGAMQLHASPLDQADSTVDVPQLPATFPLHGLDPANCPPRMRFAPSPTGSLHVGGARTALYNWLVAQKGHKNFPDSQSAFVVRVEDTDLARSTKESEDSVLADLQWLGLLWDEGPADNVLQQSQAKQPFGPYRQSERSNIYIQAAEKLLQQGKAYRCFCSPEELELMKKQQEAMGISPRYDGRWRDAPQEEINKMLDAGTPYTVRFKVPSNSRVVIDDIVRGTVSWDAEATVGDFILLRSNGVPVYNFCVAVDDALMAITTVVRAEEHLTNTVRQALVLDALEAPRPRYAHCSLILGEDKQKLSKRHGATSCDQFRLDGFLPDAMINYLALLGWNDGTDHEIFTREELIDAFELERVVKSPSIFDMEKLRWVNAQHIKMMPMSELVEMVKEQLVLENMLKDGTETTDLNLINFAFCATAIARQMMQVTKEAATNARTVLGYNLPSTFADVKDPEAKKMIEEGNFYMLATRILEEYNAGIFPLPTNPSYDPILTFQDALGPEMESTTPCPFTQSYQAHLKKIAKETKVKGKNLFHPVRLALTGEMSGQDVTKQLSLLTVATAEGSVVDPSKVDIVNISERMERLKAFCDSIPEEYRTPVSAKAAKAAASNDTSMGATGTNATGAVGSPISVDDPKDSYDGPPISALDIRVGYISKVWEHEEADKLFCEEIHVGEDEPRSIASGLRPYLKKEELEGRKVLVLCNLKQRKLVGFPSHGMVLCASNADHTEVRLVDPPTDSKVGERVTIPDFEFDGDDGEPFAENKVAKKKIFEKIAPFLLTSKYGVPEFLGRPFMTSAGVCTTPIPDGTVS